MSIEITADVIRSYGWHLKVMGAYVQEPIPSIVGLDEKTVIASNDAASLYPTSIIYQNIGYDTIRDRVYDPALIKNFITLIENVFSKKREMPQIIDSAIHGFTNALHTTLKDYFKRKSVPNKKEAEEFTLRYYPHLLKRILMYKGDLQNIYKPVDDETYYLLKSCLFPLLETITWLSPQNRGYNQLIVDYVFFHDDFISKPKPFYIIKEINSVKSEFQKIEFQEGIEHFKKRILNPYGILFDKHENNLAFDVELLIESLKKRRIIKNQMLVLEAISARFNQLSEEYQKYFLDLDHQKADKILDAIKDPKDIREKRIQSLLEISFEDVTDISELKAFIDLRSSQLNIIQLGIKVAANSAYGIYGLITWPFASPLIGNSITSAGKIYGIKLFQAVSVEVLSKIKEEDE